MMPQLSSLAAALLATVAIELAVLLFLGERRTRILAASVVVNVLTNVPLNVCVSIWPVGVGGIVALELLVVLVEALCYFWLVRSLSRSLVYSVLCNAVSFLSGVLYVLLRQLCEWND